MAEPFDYFLYRNKEGEAIYIDETITDEEAENLTEEVEMRFNCSGVSYEGVSVNKKHYFRAYFFYNDEYSYDEVEGWVDMDFISEEHAHLFHENNEDGGHYQMVKIEEWKDGELFNTKLISNADGYIR